MKIHLDPVKHKRLLKGHTVQLSKAYLSGGAGSPVDIVLSDRKQKAIAKARRLGKGYRLSLDPMEMEGEGLRDFFKTIKKGAKKVGQFYKKHLKEDVGPLLKKGVKTALDAGVVALSAAQPELAPALGVLNEKLGDKVVKAIGDTTGAYGMCCGQCGGRGVIGVQGHGYASPAEWFGSNAVYVNPRVAQPGYYAGWSMPEAFVQGAPGQPGVPRYGGSLPGASGSFRAIGSFP